MSLVSPCRLHWYRFRARAAATFFQLIGFQMLMSLVPTLISLYYMLVFWWGFFFSFFELVFLQATHRPLSCSRRCHVTSSFQLSRSLYLQAVVVKPLSAAAACHKYHWSFCSCLSAPLSSFTCHSNGRHFSSAMFKVTITFQLPFSSYNHFPADILVPITFQLPI